MIARLRRSWSGLASEQRRVLLAAGLVLVSLLLPWYTKTIAAGTAGGRLVTGHEAKMAITVPSFVEASIFLVAIAVVVLMFARGEGRAFHLPFGDGGVVTAAGAWVAFLVFYRFVDHPASEHSQNVISDYELSWGIFFGLLAAAFLLWSGLRLRSAAVPEPPLPGQDPTAPAAVSDREERRRRRAARRAAASEPGAEPPEPTPEPAPAPPPPADDDQPTTAAPPEPPTSVAPARRPQRPVIDGGEQLSFDEQER